MTITYGASVTLDESAGLQNNASTPSPAGDANDNDIAASALPSAFATRLTALGAGTAINGALSGYNGANSGANAFTFSTANATGMAFTDAAGAALNGADSGLTTTAGNVPILLYTDSVDNNIVYGKAGSTLVFAAYLQETGTPLSGAKLWMVQYSAIHDPTSDPDEAQTLLNKVYVTVDAAQSFSLANAPSGQNLFLMMGTAATSIVVTGANPANQSTGASITTGDTVNTSQGGGTTTIGANNQMIDTGEGMYFTFVTGAHPDLTIPNLDQNEADVETNIQFGGMSNEIGGQFTISQLQKDKAATVEISALTTGYHPGVAYVDNLHNNTAVMINSVKVRDATGTVVETSDGSVDTAGVNIAIDLSGNATISGLQAGYSVEYTTAGDHNRLLVTNAGGSGGKASFDIGGFKLLSAIHGTDEVGSLMRFEDAGPSVSTGTPTDSGTVETADANTIGAAYDTSTHSFASSFAGLTGGYDTDGAGSSSVAYALQLASQGENSGLASHGAALYLYATSSTTVAASTASSLAGVTSTNTVFDLGVSSSGLLTLHQYAQIDHALPGSGSNYSAQQAVLANGLVNLVGSITVTDADGDSATGNASLDLGGNVKFDDDGPHAFSPASVTLQNTGSATGTAALNAAGSEGADTVGTPAFIDTDPLSNYLYASDGTTLLKSGGQNIVLSGYGTGTLTGTTESGGLTVFTATLNAGTDQYTVTFSRPIDDGSGTSFLGAAPVKSGNPTYNIIDNVGGTSLDLLFSGGDTAGGLPGAHTVNVSTEGAGVDNQSMNSSGSLGETLRIDFDIGAVLAGSPLGSDFTPGSHKTVNGYSFLVSQNTPSGTEATAYIKVYDADNDKVLVGDPDDHADTITQVLVNNVVVYDSGGGHSGTVNGHTVTGMLYNGGVIVTGLNEGATGDGTGGDDPRVTVRTADGFNRVEVSNFAGQTVNGHVLGGAGFDIAPAGVEQGVAGNPVAFNLPVRVTDYDGDWGPTELIGVNLTPLPVV
ncbi:MAG: DUF5801 repeats-in-toxin domain-containing protein [Telluria sp.]